MLQRHSSPHVQRYLHPHPGQRWTMLKALETLEVDWPERRRPRRSAYPVRRVLHGEIQPRRRTFWERNEDQLDALAVAIRTAYLKRVRAERVDLVENHEAATQIMAAYQFCCQQLALRGAPMYH